MTRDSSSGTDAKAAAVSRRLSRVRVMVEDLDRFDFLQQALINALDIT
jgi:hypothetical protein